MVRGFAWGVLATLVIGSALGAALFLPPAPAAAPMKIWEAYARGYVTITQVDITYEHGGDPVTLPVGYRVSVSSSAPSSVVIDEPGMLMSPSPAQFGVDPDEPTTQDGALTTATIQKGSSLVFTYADEWIQGYLPAPPWWCTEQYQFTQAGVGIVLGGEVLPFAVQVIIAAPYHDSDSANSQNDVWNYFKTHPTIVVGKVPLWKEIPQTAGQIVSVAVSATNIAVRDDNDGVDGDVDAKGAVVTDTIPAGWSVVPGSYSVPPTSVSDNPDGSKLVTWVVDIAAADVTGRGPGDFDEPTPYKGIKLRYQMESPKLPAGRLDLPRAEVDTDADETVDAHSAIPVLDVLKVNNAPTAALGGPYAGLEGTPISFDAGASTDPDGDALEYRWDFESDGTWDTTYGPSPVSPPLTFGDNGVGTVTVEASDGELTSLATAAFAIVNVAPQILSLSISDADEGSPSTITVTFSDPGWLDTQTAFLDWGTGEMDTVAVAGSHDPPASTGTLTITHTYGDDFTYAGVLALVDDDGGSVVQDLSVPVANVAPTVASTDLDLFVEADVCLRVAGKSWNTVRMDLFEDNVLVGSVSVIRSQGSPNEQARCVSIEVDLLASHTYRADVTFEPLAGAKKGSNPVWVLVVPTGAKINPGHSVWKAHHVFHVGDPSTYTWSVTLTDVAAKLLGGCGCDDEDDDHDDDDECDDGKDDDSDDDGCGDDDERDDDCDDDRGDDDDRECPGSGDERGHDRDDDCGSATDGCGDRDSEDSSVDGGLWVCSRSDDVRDPDDEDSCGDSEDGCDDGDDDCSDSHEGRDDDDDEECGEEHEHDDEEEQEDDDCGGVQVHLRVTATDPGTDDLVFTWTFSDGAVEVHTFFNNGVSPDGRPSSLGVRPVVVTDSVVHSLSKPCGKQITLSVADDDGGVTTVVLTILP